MKVLFCVTLATLILSGCSSKGFDQRSYDRQNKAAEKSLDTL